MDESIPTWEDVESAAEALKGVAIKTPVMTSSRLNEEMGAQIYIKCENFQRTGAMKFRGAYNTLSKLTDDQKKGGVVGYSTGNHAIALCLAGKLLDIKITVVMPFDAPEMKKAAAEGYGGNVVLFDKYKEKGEDIANRIVAENPAMIYVPTCNVKNVIAGQGTVAKELFEEVGELDYVFTCVGGGGLTAGTCLSASKLSPNCKIYGVEPLAGNDAQMSLEQGKVVHIEMPVTIADGA